MLKHFFLSVALLSAPILAANEATMVTPPSAEENVAIDLGDLLLLSDPNTDPTQDPKEATFCKEHFSMTAQLYCAILNTVAHGGYDDLCHLYTDRIATVITRAPDAEGINHYTVVEGQEQTILGTLPCLDATQLHGLYKNQNDTYNLDEKITTNGHSSLLIKLGVTYATPSEEGIAYTHQESCSWSEQPRKDGTKADYYWLKSSTSTGSYYSVIDHDLSGELWVSLPLVPAAESSTWHATRNNKSGLHTDIKTTPAPAPTPPTNSSQSWGQWWDQLSTINKIAILTAAIAGTILLSIGLLTYLGIFINVAWNRVIFAALLLSLTAALSFTISHS